MKETKTRIIKNYITSALGVFILGIAGFAAWKIFGSDQLSTLPFKELMLRVGLIGALGSLGYVFLMAKDSILTGITMGAIKIAVPEVKEIVGVVADKISENNKEVESTK